MEQRSTGKKKLQLAFLVIHTSKDVLVDKRYKNNLIQDSFTHLRPMAILVKKSFNSRSPLYDCPSPLYFRKGRVGGFGRIWGRKKVLRPNKSSVEETHWSTISRTLNKVRHAWSWSGMRLSEVRSYCLHAWSKAKTFFCTRLLFSHCWKSWQKGN